MACGHSRKGMCQNEETRKGRPGINSGNNSGINPVINPVINSGNKQGAVLLRLLGAAGRIAYQQRQGIAR